MAFGIGTVGAKAGLFGVFNFLQKKNKNKSHSSKLEFVCSFFGGNIGLKKSF